MSKGEKRASYFAFGNAFHYGTSSQQRQELHRLLQLRRCITISQWGRTAKNWDAGTGPHTRPFAHTAHSFACSALLALLARFAALI